MAAGKKPIKPRKDKDLPDASADPEPNRPPLSVPDPYANPDLSILNDEVKEIVIVSDGTGETAAQMVRAALVQFSNQSSRITRYKNVRSEAQIDAICTTAAEENELIIFTIVSPELRRHLAQVSREMDIPTVDLLGPLLVGLGQYFNYEPKLVAGLLHDVNEDYFHRIEAMEYTIAHDDGREMKGIEKADLIILGISRTSKTPLSMYLSHQGWRVLNVPLIRGFTIPKEIFEADPKRIVGLTIDAESLVKIRRARLQRLGQERGGDYAEMDRVLDEIEYANEIYRKNRKWPVFNVTGKALEETASEIIKVMASRKISPATRSLPPRRS